jgi:hypothetical protein
MLVYISALLRGLTRQEGPRTFYYTPASNIQDQSAFPTAFDVAVPPTYHRQEVCLTRLPMFPDLKRYPGDQYHRGLVLHPSL